MNKQEFLKELEKELSGLPREDIEERLSFYGEMIDDMVEEGKTEEQAVADIGSAADIAKQIVTDTPITKIVKERIKAPRALRAWEIILIVLGFPLWFSLLIAALSTALALYIALWALIGSLWALDAAAAVFAVSSVAQAAALFAEVGSIPAVSSLGMALFSAGIAIFAFFGCVAVSKGAVILTKNFAFFMKSLFIKKEGAR